MPRRTHEESPKHWGTIVREHQASGLSARAFCDQRKITQTEFYKWRKRLSNAQKAELDSLVPVTVLDAPTDEESSRIEIRVDRSVSIFVHPGFDVTTLRDVVVTVQRDSLVPSLAICKETPMLATTGC